jgi:hypothetical protein
MASVSRIQQVNDLGVIVRSEPTLPISDGSRVVTAAVAAGNTAVTCHGAQGEVTIAAVSALAAGASVSATLTNSFINPNSHIICGIRGGTAVYAGATNGASISIVPAALSGTATVTICNGGSGAFTDGSLIYWFRVIQP